MAAQPATRAPGLVGYIADNRADSCAPSWHAACIFKAVQCPAISARRDNLADIRYEHHLCQPDDESSALGKLLQGFHWWALLRAGGLLAVNGKAKMKCHSFLSPYALRLSTSCQYPRQCLTHQPFHLIFFDGAFENISVHSLTDLFHCHSLLVVQPSYSLDPIWPPSSLLLSHLLSYLQPLLQVRGFKSAQSGR